MKASPRVLSRWRMKWMLNLYPPLLFTRVRIKEFGEGFRTCRVVVGRSLLTRNLHGTTYGGAIFNGFDPIYPILYWQIFARRGEALRMWLKAADIDYRKPASSALTINFVVTDEDIERARAGMDENGKYVAVHEADAVDEDGAVCVRGRMHVYMRRLSEGQTAVSGF